MSAHVGRKTSAIRKRITQGSSGVSTKNRRIFSTTKVAGYEIQRGEFILDNLDKIAAIILTTRMMVTVACSITVKSQRQRSVCIFVIAMMMFMVVVGMIFVAF